MAVKLRVYGLSKLFTKVQEDDPWRCHTPTGQPYCNVYSLRKQTVLSKRETLDRCCRFSASRTLSSSPSSSSLMALQASLAKLPPIFEVATLALYGLRTGLRWLRSLCVGIGSGLPLL